MNRACAGRIAARAHRLGGPLLAAALAFGGSAADAAEGTAPATLRVTSTPDADVTLDGVARGRTPVEIPDLAAGSHQLTLVSSGFLERRQTLTVAPGERMTVAVVLTPAEAARKGRWKEKALMIGLPILAGGGTAAYVSGRNADPTLAGIAVEPGSVGIMGVTSYVFTAVGAADEDGNHLTFSWDFGDGKADEGATVRHTFAAEGAFTVRLTVSDGKASRSATAAVTVASLTGTWSGRLTDCPWCANAPTFTLTQRGTHVSGSFQDDVNGSGPANGTFTSARELWLVSAVPGYREGSWFGVVSEDGRTIRGSVDWYSSGPRTFTLDRR